MESKLTLTKKEKSKGFPKPMIHRISCGCLRVVLFKEKGIGTVVYEHISGNIDGLSKLGLGHYSEEWSHVMFEDFEGLVEIFS